MGIFPNFRGENKKCLKPPPRFGGLKHFKTTYTSLKIEGTFPMFRLIEAIYETTLKQRLRSAMMCPPTETDGKKHRVDGSFLVHISMVNVEVAI